MDQQQIDLPAATALRNNVVTGMAERLVGGVLQEWLDQFLDKNRKYRALDGNSLGAKGVFVDVHRKFGVLKSRVWDGDSEVGSNEPTVEIIDDLIGHLFLMRDFLLQESLPEWDGTVGRLQQIPDDYSLQHNHTFATMCGRHCPAWASRGVGRVPVAGDAPRPVKDSPQG